VREKERERERERDIERERERERERDRRICVMYDCHCIDGYYRLPNQLGYD
jgi:hypothetical protein